jgi:hypothetical protein
LRQTQSHFLIFANQALAFVPRFSTSPREIEKCCSEMAGGMLVADQLPLAQSWSTKNPDWCGNLF